jgi:hypothetical protein
MHTNYHTPTSFDTIVPSSDSLQSIPCQVTPVFHIQLSVTQFTIKLFHTGFVKILILELLKSQYYKIIKTLKLSIFISDSIWPPHSMTSWELQQQNYFKQMLTNIQSNTANYLLLIILTLVTSATCFGVLIRHLQAVKQTVVLLNCTVPLGSHAPVVDSGTVQFVCYRQQEGLY